MTGPQYPPAGRPTNDGVLHGSPSSGQAPFSDDARPDRPAATADPALVPDVQTWLGDMVKAAKGFRVYADNNEMLVKFVDHAFVGLEFLLARDPELTLSIREDRILYGKEVVHVSADRQEGLPFLLYRNAFRRLVLVQGIKRDELVGLMRALSTDFSSYDHAGEDLVTTLWRLQLPHVRYLTIDTLSRFRSEAADEAEQEEIERIQGDIENIVAAIYRTSAADDDLVAGVSISREDLEALREVRAENPEDLELLDHATERAITDVPDGQLRRVQDDLRTESQEELTRRVLNILIQILFRETSSQKSALTIDLIQDLFDAMVLARRYSDAIQLVKKLRHHADHGDTMQEIHVARHLLNMLATESKVVPVLATLNEQHYAVSSSELFEFLRALGPPVSPILVRALDSLTSPAHRRATCDLIVELGVPSLAILAGSAHNAKWFVVRDILGLAQQYDLAEIGPLVAMGLGHEHPRVRQLAVGMLRGYGRGTADQALAARFFDDDIEVRLAAYRIAAARRSRDVMPALEGILTSDKIGQREDRELRLMMAAYAAIGGATSIDVLSRVLNVGLIASLTNTDAQVAAAYALASIGAEASNALQRGSRTLNPKVREACRRALSRDLQRRQAQRELLRGRLPGTTEEEAPTSNPGGPKSAGIGTSSIDMDFKMSETGTIDPLSGAPPFRVDVPLPVDPPPVQAAVDRPRPALPRVDGPGMRDEIPINIPPPPSLDLPPLPVVPPGPANEAASAGAGRLNVLGEHSVDFVPTSLPPVPAPATSPEGLSEPPPVFGSAPSDADAFQGRPLERRPSGVPLPEPESGSLSEPPPIIGPLGEDLRFTVDVPSSPDIETSTISRAPAPAPSELAPTVRSISDAPDTGPLPETPAVRPLTDASGPLAEVPEARPLRAAPSTGPRTGSVPLEPNTLNPVPSSSAELVAPGVDAGAAEADWPPSFEAPSTAPPWSDAPPVADPSRPDDAPPGGPPWPTEVPVVGPSWPSDAPADSPSVGPSWASDAPADSPSVGPSWASDAPPVAPSWPSPSPTPAAPPWSEEPTPAAPRPYEGSPDSPASWALESPPPAPWPTDPAGEAPSWPQLPQPQDLPPPPVFESSDGPPDGAGSDDLDVHGETRPPPVAPSVASRRPARGLELPPFPPAPPAYAKNPPPRLPPSSSPAPPRLPPPRPKAEGRSASTESPDVWDSVSTPPRLPPPRRPEPRTEAVDPADQMTTPTGLIEDLTLEDDGGESSR